jgi:hypothetical protein
MRSSVASQTSRSGRPRSDTRSACGESLCELHCDTVRKLWGWYRAQDRVFMDVDPGPDELKAT